MIGYSWDKQENFYFLSSTRFDYLLILGYCMSVVGDWESVQSITQGSSRDRNVEKINTLAVRWDRLTGEIFPKLLHCSSRKLVSVAFGSVGKDVLLCYNHNMYLSYELWILNFCLSQRTGVLTEYDQFLNFKSLFFKCHRDLVHSLWK